MENNIFLSFEVFSAHNSDNHNMARTMLSKRNDQKIKRIEVKDYLRSTKRTKICKCLVFSDSTILELSV